MKLQCEYLQIQLPLSFFSLNLYCSMPFQNIPVPHTSKISNNVSAMSLFYHVKSPSMHNFTVEIRNDSYMFQLHSSHQTTYVSSIKGNHVPVFYILLQMISGRYFGLTYKGR